MPTGFTYTSYQSAVVTQIPTLTTDPNFTTILPDAIDYAELSIYRDMDFLAMHGLLSLGNTTAHTNLQAVPSGVVVLEALYYGSSNVPVTPASQDYIRAVYAGATEGPPVCFAAIGAGSGTKWAGGVQILLGPAPDTTYALTGYVTEREPPLSGSNTTTFISLNLPDLFWAASMIFFAGYNRNFGAQADDPRQAISWEHEYQRILKGSSQEEIRKKFLSQEATAKLPQARLGAQPAPPQGG